LSSAASIAGVFAPDVHNVDPATRGVADVKHRIVAVASRSEQKARAFVNDKLNGDASIRVHGSYEALFADDNVDVIYVSTPHALHYQNVRAALDAVRVKVG
jgi:predicted dehydrogenase